MFLKFDQNIEAYFLWKSYEKKLLKINFKVKLKFITNIFMNIELMMEYLKH